MIKVLVVDDSALMRKAIGTMLVESGEFVVETARNGEDALAAIPRVDPDVVTLDINMPVMDGLTCLAAIMRDFPRPVVMVSSLSERAALVTLEALELGAVDYLPKPGGTVSLNMDQVRAELVAKVRQAASTRGRPGGLVSRLRRQREQTYAGRTPEPRPGSTRPAHTGPAHARPSAPARARRQTTRTGVELVLIGSSTGGPALLSRLIGQLPANFPAAVLVAQHLPATFTGALARRLNEQSPMPVCEVTAITPISTGHVYIARGDSDMLLSRRAGVLSARPAPSSTQHAWHPSVDRLVASALDTVDPGRTIGVLLTGMGDDGAEQMTRLHTAGGRTIAESEQSAIVWGMPGQLVARRGASIVLDADQVGDQLLAWV
jgi:two-component system, chemotaxis family, protein-glutamate methylesterase/glutaminase